MTFHDVSLWLDWVLFIQETKPHTDPAIQVEELAHVPYFASGIKSSFATILNCSAPYCSKPWYHFNCQTPYISRNKQSETKTLKWEKSAADLRYLCTVMGCSWYLWKCWIGVIQSWKQVDQFDKWIARQDTNWPKWLPANYPNAWGNFTIQFSIMPEWMSKATGTPCEFLAYKMESLTKRRGSTSFIRSIGEKTFLKQP